MECCLNAVAHSQKCEKGRMTSELVSSCLIALLHWRLNQVTCEFTCRGNLQRPPEIGKGKNDVRKGHCRAGLSQESARLMQARVNLQKLEECCCWNAMCSLTHCNRPVYIQLGTWKFPFCMEICHLKMGNFAATTVSMQTRR